MNRIVTKQTAIVLLIALIVMSFSSLAFAKKPENMPETAQKPTSSISIVTPDKQYTVPVDGVLSFNVIAKYRPKPEATTIDWMIEPVSTTHGAIIVQNKVKNITSFAEVTFTPTGSDEGVIYEYLITAFDHDNPTIFDTMTVQIAVTPDVEVYVALGDSIPLGSYVDFDPEPFKNHHETYVDMFGSAMVAEEIYNYAVDGAKIEDLVYTTPSAIMLANLARADVITLSIGGNNLMQSAMYPPLEPYPMYNFNKINLLAAEFGQITFVELWPQLIAMIKSINPDVTLLVLNIYNPYSSTETGSTVHFIFPSTEIPVATDVNLRLLIDSFLYKTPYGMGINDAVELQADLFYYLVVDAYSAFGEDDSYTHFYDMPIDSPFRDPHPSQKGQNRLAELHEEILSKYYKDLYF